MQWVRVPVAITSLTLLCGANPPESNPPPPPYVGLARTLDPAVLAALDEEQFRSRLYVALAWVHAARLGGVSPEATMKRAFDALGYSDAAAALAKDALLRSLAKLDGGGVFKKPANWKAMTEGGAPTVVDGLTAGEKLISSFVVPPIRAPRFAREIANLELLPESEAAKAPRDLLDARRKAYLDKLGQVDAPPVAAPDVPALTGTSAPAPVEPAPPMEWTGPPAAERTIRVELPVGQVLDLTPFIGERYGILLDSDTTSEIRYGVTDYSSYIIVTRIDAFGYPYTARVPRSNSYTREKRDGLEVRGQGGKAYPIFEIAGVVRVLFHDTLARSDNERVLLIETPEGARAPDRYE